MLDPASAARSARPGALLWLALTGCNTQHAHAPGMTAAPAPVAQIADAGSPQAAGRERDGAQPPHGGAGGMLSTPGHAAAASGSGAAAPAAAAPQEPPADPHVPPEIAQHAHDWPLPNHDYDNTRNADTHIDSSNIAQLREAWRLPLESGTTFGYATSNPLILGERVYFQDMLSNVYVLERATGKPVWKRSHQQPSFGPNGVAIGWGKLFTTADDSTLVALDLESGAPIWKLAPELGHSEGIDVQPVLYDRTLFAASVPVSQARGVYEGGTHGKLWAIDADKGSLRWAFDTIDSPDAWGDSAANGGGGAWYPPLIVPELALTYWGTGNPVPWPGSADKPNGGSRPGPNLYTSSLVALGLEDGALHWHYQDRPHDLFDWDFQSTPVRVRAAAASGADMVIGAGKTGAVAALDGRTGELLWRTKVGKHMNDELTEFPAQSLTIYPGVLGGVMSAMAYADGVLYVPSVDLSMSYDGNLLLPGVSGGTGTLSALDVRDGKLLWSAQLAGACYGAATLANDLVLTSDENGRVYAFAKQTGREVWHYDAPSGINAPLVAAGDELIVSVGLGQGMVLGLSLHASTGAAGASAPAADGGAGAAGHSAPAEPTFSAVYRDILQGAGCSGGPTCHASTLAGQLDLSTPAKAYTALVNAKAQGASCSASNLLRVAPGDPDASLLVSKLSSATPVCGGRMPPSGMLAPERLAQLRAWIAAGAHDD